MPSRLIKPRAPHSKKKPGVAIHQDEHLRSDAFVSIVSPSRPASAVSSNRSAPTEANKATRPSHSNSSSRTTLSSATDAAVNVMTARSSASKNGTTVNSSSNPNRRTLPPPTSDSTLRRMISTIRTVRSFEDIDARFSEDSSTNSTPPSFSASRNSAFSSSINSDASGISSDPQQQSYVEMYGKHANGKIRQRHTDPALDEPASALEVPKAGRPSVEVGRNSIEIPQRESSLSAKTMKAPVHTEPPPAVSVNHNEAPPSAADGANGWDSSVGKAGLGKTGRVINRLVSENESLKRDIQIERLRAEESKQTARLLEDKMDRITSEYESRLLEANVTKTLLARKERQVESLQSTVDLERKRAVDAGDRERIWKDELEKVRAEAKQQIEEATNHAMLMEGRYTAISSHWKEQGEEVKKTVAKMKGEIDQLVAERRRDDDKISTLRDLCDQQDGNIRDLRRQKEDVAAQFERYKLEQEEMLRHIKTNARRREEEQEKTIAEAREVLDKLRWALNVKEKVEWAQ